MAMPERYVFVCLNQRPAGHPKGSCLDRGAADVFNALREEQGRRLLTGVKVVATGCMEGCLAGPALLVHPDNVWYGAVTEADVPEEDTPTSTTAERADERPGDQPTGQWPPTSWPSSS